MRSTRPRIVILALPLGGGHLAVARSIAGHLEQSAPGRYEISIEHLSDHVRFGERSISGSISAVYQWTLANWSSHPYRMLYNLADRHPRLIARLAYLLFGSRAQTWLLEQRADLIISTYPLVTSVVGRAVSATGVRTISVVTDAGRVTRLWWVGRTDLTVVMHHEVVEAALAFGVASSKVLDVGLVVDPSIKPVDSEQTARTGSRAGFTVLLAAGGQGFGPNLHRFATLMGQVDDHGDLEFVIAAGTNVEWADELSDCLSSRRVRRAPAVGMHELLPTIDLVVGKAGWITLAECFAAAKPVIVVDTIPGQEEENAAFATRQRFVQQLSPEEAVAAVMRFAEDPSLLAVSFVQAHGMVRDGVGRELVSVIDALLGDGFEGAALSGREAEVRDPSGMERLPMLNVVGTNE